MSADLRFHVRLLPSSGEVIAVIGTEMRDGLNTEAPRHGGL